MTNAILEAQQAMRDLARNLEAQLMEFHTRTGLTMEMSVKWNGPDGASGYLDLHDLHHRRTAMSTKAKERAVIVTTSHRGVFFGYITDAKADPLPMRAARNVIYWPVENHGFLGLAAYGPKPGARVGPPADIEIKAITCVAAVSPEALKVWEKVTW